MRTIIYDYIKNLNLMSLSLSAELPYQSSGVALYLKNKRIVYVDTDQVQQDSLTDTLDGTGAVDEITKVSVYFANDAKRLIPDYDTVVDQIKAARTTAGTEGYIQKLCQVSTSYDEDTIVTTLEFSFRKLIIN